MKSEDVNQIAPIAPGAVSDVTYVNQHLKSIPTRQLVEELAGREGVECFYAEPYEEKPISVSGPAVIMVIID